MIANANNNKQNQKLQKAIYKKKNKFLKINKSFILQIKKMSSKKKYVQIKIQYY